MIRTVGIVLVCFAWVACESKVTDSRYPRPAGDNDIQHGDGNTGDSPAGDIAGPPDALTLTGLTVSMGTISSTVRAQYVGDENGNASAMLWYCRMVEGAPCDPTAGSSIAMTRGSSFSASMPTQVSDSGLDQLMFRVRVEGTDPDGVVGSPLTEDVDIPINRIELANDFEFSNHSSSGFDVALSFYGDHDVDGAVTLYWINEQDNPDFYTPCSPYPSCGVEGNVLFTPLTMTRGDGVFTASITGLVPPDDPGDRFQLFAIADDPDGVRIGSATFGYAHGATTLLKNDLLIDTVALTRVANGLSAVASFRGDDDGDASLVLDYCDRSANDTCAPSGGERLALARTTEPIPYRFGEYTGDVTPLPSPMQSGDVLAVLATATDPEGVDGGASGQIESRWYASAVNDMEAGGNTWAATAVSGTWAAVGAPGRGEVWLYENTGTSWVRRSNLTGADDSFGADVAMDGDLLVVGEHGASPNGAARAYRLTTGTWVEDTSFVATGASPSDAFGRYVAASGTRVAVSAPLIDAVYVYSFGGSSWSMVELTGSAGFGASVAMSGDRLVVGATDNAGAVQLYAFDGSDWQLEATLVADWTTAGFGGHVAISGDRLLVGSRESNVVAMYEWSGSSWELVRTFDEHPDDVSWNYCTSSVALSGDTLALATRRPCNPSTPNYGTGRAVYLIQLADPWLVHRQVTIERFSTVDAFRLLYGYDVAVSGDAAVLGAADKGWDVNGEFRDIRGRIFH